MKRYVVYGIGLPVVVESYSPEVAEATVVELYGADIQRLTTFEEGSLNGLLSRGSHS